MVYITRGNRSDQGRMNILSAVHCSFFYFLLYGNLNFVILLMFYFSPHPPGTVFDGFCQGSRHSPFIDIYCNGYFKEGIVLQVVSIDVKIKSEPPAIKRFVV